MYVDLFQNIQCFLHYEARVMVVVVLLIIFSLLLKMHAFFADLL